MEWISLGRTVETLHVLAACALVGGQLFISAAAWRGGAGDGAAGAEALGRLEGFYRLFALLFVVVTIAFGLWLLRFTLVSDLLLVSTPYGPALGMKVVGTLAFTAYLLVAPPLLGPLETRSGRARRIWAAIGALLVIGLLGVSTSLRYL